VQIVKPQQNSPALKVQIVKPQQNSPAVEQ